MDRSRLWIYGECVSAKSWYSTLLRLTRYRLSVFFVALADWFVFGLKPSIATYVGGAMIFVAFVLLTKHTLGESKH